MLIQNWIFKVDPFVWKLLEETDINVLWVSTFRKQDYYKTALKLHLLCICVCTDVVNTFNTNIWKEIFQKLAGSYVFSSWNAEQFLYSTTQTYRQKHPVITFRYEVVYHENMEDSIYQSAFVISMNCTQISQGNMYSMSAVNCQCKVQWDWYLILNHKERWEKVLSWGQKWTKCQIKQLRWCSSKSEERHMQWNVAIIITLQLVCITLMFTDISRSTSRTQELHYYHKQWMAM
jgi:hypothetical protein